MPSLLINAYYRDKQYFVDIRTSIIMYIYKLASPCDIQLEVGFVETMSNEFISVALNDFNFVLVHSDTCELSQLCTWPIIRLDNYIISGLCSVARKLCKISGKESVRKLLGFRESCLVACAESSVWTKFCEIDITETINGILNYQYIDNDYCFTLPHNILKYEHHLAQPVRVHNIYKLARDNLKNQSLQSSVPIQDLQLFHDYAGPYITLADIVLYPCFKVFYKYCIMYNLNFDHNLPLIKKWVDRLEAQLLTGFEFQLNLPRKVHHEKIVVPDVSLYNTDPSRVVSVKHTKQYKIEQAIEIIESIKREIVNSIIPFGSEVLFNWNDIPLIANPLGGALPAKRADRKREQLETLTKAAIKVVGDKHYKIVDFCSGSGHLGILVALSLPNSKIILVENKEHSLSRAKQTISKLGLTNIVIVQSNLDYFIGKFDLGLALHACGVATDLVLQMCIKSRADFICCPCCYGGIKPCHGLSYPRSKKFRDVFLNAEDQFFNLAHAADQTHEVDNTKTKQGYFCMDVIDSDRRFYAEDCGYRVHLGKLQPVTCTNKNNLLVGIYVRS